MHRVAAMTDKGMVREHNEDSLLWTKLATETGTPIAAGFLAEKTRHDILLAVVADGVGGLAAGEVASRLAVETFTTSVISYLSPEVLLKTSVTDEISFRALSNAIDNANNTVRSSVMKAGTTLTSALVWEDGRVHIASVGDSRAYIINPGDSIVQVTQDQSLAWQDFVATELPLLQKELDDILRDGSKTQEDVRSWEKQFLLRRGAYIAGHPESHTIWNVIGYYAEVGSPSYHKLYMDNAGILLLCSDGLTDELNDLAILDTVSQAYTSGRDNMLQTSARTLVEQAKQSGGHDNISLVMVSWEPDPSSQYTFVCPRP